MQPCKKSEAERLSNSINHLPAVLTLKYPKAPAGGHLAQPNRAGARAVCVDPAAHGRTAHTTGRAGTALLLALAVHQTHSAPASDHAMPHMHMLPLPARRKHSYKHRYKWYGSGAAAAARAGNQELNRYLPDAFRAY